MADYTLEARVTADTSDFNSGMSDAAEALGDLGSQASRAGASAGKAGGGLTGFSAKCSALTGAVMGAAASITSNLVGGFGDLVSRAAEAADSTQKFASTLEFAGIGADEIESLSKSTRKYADQTVYSLSDIQNTTAQLAANGVKDYDRLAEAAGNLNAVAGGNASTFQSVGQVMTQTAGAGKLMTENWNQLTDAIPGASGALQQAMRDAGAFEGNFREAMENGEISADEFFAAVQKLGLTDVAQEAATSTATIEGAMGNLQATLEGGLADSITILTPAITTLANSISENLGPAFETFNGFLQTFVDGLDAGKEPIQAFADAFVTLPEPVQQVATAIGALGAAFAAYKIASTFLGIAQGVQGLVSGFSGLGSSVGPATSALGGVSSSASSAALQIAAVGVAALGIGAGIGAAAAGMSMLVQAAIQLGSAGPAAQIAMVGLVVGIAALAAGAVAAGPALTAAALGVGVFGAAVLGIGAGIGIAAAGLALLATQLPTIASSGGDAGAAMLQIAAGAAAMSAGIAACGVALAATAAAMVAATASFGAFSLAVGAAALAASASNGQFRGLYDSVEGIPAKVDGASDAFHELGPSAEDAGREASKAIADACDDMRREVSGLKLRLPRIEVGPLPHFSLRGSFNPQTGSVPSVSVSWYAKGGVFDGASVIGVGERGPEAVVPLTGRRMEPFAQAIADAMGGSGTTNVYYIGDTNVTTMDDRSFAESFIRLMTDSGRLART